MDACGFSDSAASPARLHLRNPTRDRLDGTTFKLRRPSKSLHFSPNRQETLQPKARKISANAGFNQTASPCIIRSGVRATSSEYWPRRKIPPPSSLDGRVGSRSPSAALNTSGSYKLDERSARAVGLPSPRNLGKKLIVKQRALVVYLYTKRSPT